MAASLALSLVMICWRQPLARAACAIAGLMTRTALLASVGGWSVSKARVRWDKLSRLVVINTSTVSMIKGVSSENFEALR